MSNVDKDHDKDSTHWACEEALMNGGKTPCCHCSGHRCKQPNVGRPLKNDWRVEFDALCDIVDGPDWRKIMKGFICKTIINENRQAVADTLDKLDPTLWNKPSDATRVGWDYCADEIKRRITTIKKEYEL